MKNIQAILTKLKALDHAFIVHGGPYAVLIAYDVDLYPVPIVISKAEDLFKDMLIEEAQKSETPILEDAAFAEKIYTELEEHDYIDQDHYTLVAEKFTHIFEKWGGPGPRPL